MQPNIDARQIILCRRARKWRVASIGGGALLAAAFFMPAIKGCSSPIVPAAEVVATIHESPLAWAPSFYVFVATYLFGFLAALRCLAGMTGWRKVEPICLILIGSLLLAGCLVSIIAFGVMAISEITSLESMTAKNILNKSIESIGVILVLFMFPVWGLLYLRLTRRAKNHRWMGPLFFMSLWCIAWFSMWLILSQGDGIYYGFYCSMVGSLVLCLGVTGEIAALSDQSFLLTLGALLIARLPSLVRNRGCCRQCGYSLIGLPEPRCPECGTAFDPNDVEITLTRQGVA